MKDMTATLARLETTLTSLEKVTKGFSVAGGYEGQLSTLKSTAGEFKDEMKSTSPNLKRCSDLSNACEALFDRVLMGITKELKNVEDDYFPNQVDAVKHACTESQFLLVSLRKEISDIGKELSKELPKAKGHEAAASVDISDDNASKYKPR